MERNLGATVLADNEWELLFDAEALNGPVRELIIKNPISSANGVEIFVTPNDGSEAPDDPTVRYSIAPGETETIAAMSGAGGMITKVYVRSAGATIAHRVRIF